MCHGSTLLILKDGSGRYMEERVGPGEVRASRLRSVLVLLQTHIDLIKCVGMLRSIAYMWESPKQFWMGRGLGIPAARL